MSKDERNQLMLRAGQKIGWLSGVTLTSSCMAISSGSLYWAIAAGVFCTWLVSFVVGAALVAWCESAD